MAIREPAVVLAVVVRAFAESDQERGDLVTEARDEMQRGFAM